MDFKSAFNIGDKVWIVHHDLPALVTIGKIIIEHTDSPGISDEELFDNYKSQKNYKESYMCVETGIESGSVWELNKNIFSTHDKCFKAIQVGRK